ncbi:MAG: hypothetical protein EOP07_04085, partial [Proteobacteria bacterium]
MRFGNKFYLPMFYSLVSIAAYYLISISLGSQIALLASFLLIILTAFAAGLYAGLAVSIACASLALLESLQSGSVLAVSTLEIALLLLGGISVSAMGGLLQKSKLEQKKAVLKVERHQRG